MTAEQRREFRITHGLSVEEMRFINAVTTADWRAIYQPKGDNND